MIKNCVNANMTKEELIEQINIRDLGIKEAEERDIACNNLINTMCMYMDDMNNKLHYGGIIGTNEYSSMKGWLKDIKDVISNYKSLGSCFY